MELNNEQIQILRFLYDHPTEVFSYAQLSQLNIPSILSDTGNLSKKGLIYMYGYNECNLTYKITPEGRAAYEAYVSSQDEKDFNVDSTKKSLELAEEANVLSKEANANSKAARKHTDFWSAISVSIAFVSLLLALISLITTLVKS